MRLNLRIHIVSKNRMTMTSVTSQLLCKQNIGKNLICYEIDKLKNWSAWIFYFTFGQLV